MKKLLLTLLVGISVQSYSQVNNDVEQWTGAALTLKLNKKIQFIIAPEIRFNQNVSNISSVFSDFGVRFKANDFFAIKANYRYSIRPNRDDKQRANVDFLFTAKKKKFPLSFRYRLRGQFSDQLNSNKYEVYARSQFKFKYNLSKLVDPYTSFELFFKFRANEFRNWRYVLGLDWRLTKKLGLNTFYGYEREIFKNNPSGAHIFGLGLGYQLKL